MTRNRLAGDTRAAAAARSVRELFGRRLFGIPGTYLPHVSVPSPGRFGPWHYWWLAHFLDCLIDEADRERRAGSPQRAEYAGTLALRLLRTIRIRNGLRFANHYYDDMAWLLLAVQRLQQLHDGISAPACARRLARTAHRVLAPAVLAGEDADTGGVYWNDSRELKNVAATGPAAIYVARAGDPGHANRLVEWLYRTLFDPQSGLMFDGVRRETDGSWSPAPAIYTYNQGTVLGALLALADPRPDDWDDNPEHVRFSGPPAANERATALVDAIHDHLAIPGEPPTLVTYGGHDGGLFTGIAARYLALAARSPDLASAVRERAADLVRGTADALWDGRREAEQDGIPALWVFSPDPARPAAQTQPPGTTVELSTQIQAWTVLEAAHTLERS